MRGTLKSELLTLSETQNITQPTFTCSTTTMDTQKQCEKSVYS